MGRIVKSMLYLAITFTFVLLMADFVSFSLISHNEIVLNCECPDFSKHCEHSDTHCFEDEVQYYEAKAKPYKLEILRDSLLFPNPNFAHSFNSKIWQPPKNS
jgi:hypothetical protein